MARGDIGLLEYLAVLERQQQEHKAALAELEIAISHARRVMKEESVRAKLPGADNGVPEERARETGGPYVHMGLGEATYRYLVSVGEMQNTAQVRRGLIRGGLVSTAKNLHSTVFTSLKRLVDKGKVEKVGAGEWVAVARVEQGLLGHIR